MLEKYHLMPRQWDSTYKLDVIIPKLLRDLEDKDHLEAIANMKAIEKAEAEAKAAADKAKAGAN